MRESVSYSEATDWKVATQSTIRLIGLWGTGPWSVFGSLPAWHNLKLESNSLLFTFNSVATTLYASTSNLNNIYIYIAEPEDPCASYPCKNGGTCHASEDGKSFTCVCKTDLFVQPHCGWYSRLVWLSLLNTPAGCFSKAICDLPDETGE